MAVPCDKKNKGQWFKIFGGMGGAVLPATHSNNPAGATPLDNSNPKLSPYEIPEDKDNGNGGNGFNIRNEDGDLSIQAPTQTKGKAIQGITGINNLLKWKFIPQGDGKYIIKNLSRNGLVIENSNSVNKVGNPIIGNNQTGKPNQIWTPLKINNGDSFILKNPETGKCMDANPVGFGHGYELQECDPTKKSQRFGLNKVPAGNPFANLPRDGYFKLKQGNKCTSVNKHSARIQVKQCPQKEDPSSVWRWIPHNGYYVIENKIPLVFDNQQDRDKVANPIIGHKKHGKRNQQFRAIPVNDKQFMLWNPYYNKCIEQVGSLFELHECNKDKASQLFELEQAPKSETPQNSCPAQNSNGATNPPRHLPGVPTPPHVLPGSNNGGATNPPQNPSNGGANNNPPHYFPGVPTPPHLLPGGSNGGANRPPQNNNNPYWPGYPNVPAPGYPQFWPGFPAPPQSMPGFPSYPNNFPGFPSWPNHPMNNPYNPYNPMNNPANNPFAPTNPFNTRPKVFSKDDPNGPHSYLVDSDIYNTPNNGPIPTFTPKDGVDASDLKNF